jgi:hypothetical protein
MPANPDPPPLQGMWCKYKARKKWGPLLDQARDQARLEALRRHQVEEEQRARMAAAVVAVDARLREMAAERQQRELQELLVGGGWWWAGCWGCGGSGLMWLLCWLVCAAWAEGPCYPCPCNGLMYVW